MTEADKLSQQQEIIERVVNWIKEEGYDPIEVTHLNKNANYFATIKVSEKKGFNIVFPSKNLDSLLIIAILRLKKDFQIEYMALQRLDKNRLFFDIKIALLQMNVHFDIRDGVESINIFEVKKVIYFDGLTKDKLFDTIYSVGNSVEIIKVKLGQFRDSLFPSMAGQPFEDTEYK